MILTAVPSRLLDPAIAVHVVAAVLALGLGAWVLAARKGTRSHRLAGRGWAVAMAVTAASSFFIAPRILPVATPLGSFGPIHLLSAFTLLALWQAIAAIRRGDVARHRRAMLRAFSGLAVAGVFALLPGRALNAWMVALSGMAG
jgi:uncharacterized membrane protein